MQTTGWIADFWLAESLVWAQLAGSQTDELRLLRQLEHSPWMLGKLVFEEVNPYGPSAMAAEPTAGIHAAWLDAWQRTCRILKWVPQLRVGPQDVEQITAAIEAARAPCRPLDTGSVSDA
jgi:hypothetical protein